jgi:tetratricopeptide (TPR) repeat protein
MRGIPGEIFERPWRHFGESRTECLELARPFADYTLILDADDVLEYPEGARFPALTEPAYALLTQSGPIQFPRIYLLHNGHPWRFVGRCHEVAVCEGVDGPALLRGIVYRRIGGGARDRDPQKYLRDAALLEEDLRHDPTNRRSAFLLAQSYEDGGDLPRALAHYERRALMGGWDEEVYAASFGAARVREKLGAPYDQVTRAYLAAARLRPHRAEPLYVLARLARAAGDLTAARAYAAQACELPMPEGELFVHVEIYGWRALDEYAGASLHLGDAAEAIRANERILARTIPETERARVVANLDLCKAAGTRRP